MSFTLGLGVLEGFGLWFLGLRISGCGKRALWSSWLKEAFVFFKRSFVGAPKPPSRVSDVPTVSASSPCIRRFRVYGSTSTIPPSSPCSKPSVTNACCYSSRHSCLFCCCYRTVVGELLALVASSFCCRPPLPHPHHHGHTTDIRIPPSAPLSSSFLDRYNPLHPNSSSIPVIIPNIINAIFVIDIPVLPEPILTVRFLS